MLRDAPEELSVLPYFDPVLRFNQKVYQKLIQKLAGIGLLQWTTQPSCMVGMFFVEKDGGRKQRLIIDA